MGIAYGISDNNIERFNATTRVPFQPGGANGWAGSHICGNLTVYGINGDCTSLHIHNVTALFYTGTPEYKQRHAKPAEQALEEIKRYMHYSGKNTAFLTLAHHKDNPTHAKDVEARAKELDLEIVSEQPGAREHYITKYVLLLKVDPKKIGYYQEVWSDFTDDPWFRMRPENQKPVETVVKKAVKKVKEMVNV